MPLFIDGNPENGPGWTDLTGPSVGGGGGGVRRSVGANGPEVATLVMLLGEGEVEGTYDDLLKSVYLDGTPIIGHDGTKNFSGVAVALVAGTNTQTDIPGIDFIESDTVVNVQATKAASVTRTITSNPSAIRIRVRIPGLRVANANGSTTGHFVDVKVERQNASYNGGNWETVQLENNGRIGGGPTSNDLFHSYRIELPMDGAWQVKFTRLSDDDPPTGPPYKASQTWWDAYTEIVDVRLRYPNRSILALRLNSLQFDSVPQVSVDMRLLKVKVPTNYTPRRYDPATGITTPASYATSGPGTTGGVWDGTFKTAWSANPAWAFRNAATNTRYGAGSFLSESGIDDYMLYAIAQWCDTLVPDGKGGTEPRMECNFFAQTPNSAIKALYSLASVFWGVLFYGAGVVTPIADTDVSVSSIFTNSNVEGRTFTYEGTSRAARHTAAIVSYINPDLGWTEDVAVHEDAEGIARFGYNVSNTEAIGCISQGQATRLARWIVVTELLATEMVMFTTGLLGSYSMPGDVIEIADQFRAGHARTGGVVASATNSVNAVVTLDAPVTLEAGTYTLRVQTSSGVETKTVSTGAGTTSTLTVVGTFSSAPVLGNAWLLLKNTDTPSLWRVIKVKKGEGIQFEIAAIKHDPAKYALLDLGPTDVIPRRTVVTNAPAPSGLVITAETTVLNDRQQCTLYANWTPDGATSHVAMASKEYGPWVGMAVSGSSASLDSITPGSWRVRVASEWRSSGQSDWTVDTFVVVPSSVQPTWVAQALTSIDNIGADNVVSDAERPMLKMLYMSLSAEVSDIQAKATAKGLGASSEYTALSAAWAPFASPSGAAYLIIYGTGDTAIVKATFDGYWSTAYSAMSSLYTKLSGVHATIYWQATMPTGGVYQAGDMWVDTTTTNYPIFTWDGAQWTATQDSASVRALYDSMASDGILSKSEKPKVIIDFETAKADKITIDQRVAALNYSSQAAAYNAAYSNLYNMVMSDIAPSYADVAVDSVIPSPTNWTDYWVAHAKEKTNLLLKLSTAAVPTIQAVLSTNQNLLVNAGATITTDGYTWVNGDKVMLIGQTTVADDGIYSLAYTSAGFSAATIFAASVANSSGAGGITNPTYAYNDTADVASVDVDAPLVNHTTTYRAVFDGFSGGNTAGTIVSKFNVLTSGDPSSSESISVDYSLDAGSTWQPLGAGDYVAGTDYVASSAALTGVNLSQVRVRFSVWRQMTKTWEGGTFVITNTHAIVDVQTVKINAAASGSANWMFVNKSAVSDQSAWNVTGTTTYGGKQWVATVATSGDITSPLTQSAGTVLPVATPTVLGGVKQGSGVNIDAAGVISVTGVTAYGMFTSSVPTPAAGAVYIDAAGGGRIITVGATPSTYAAFGIDQYTSDLSGYRRAFDVSATGAVTFTRTVSALALTSTYANIDNQSAPIDSFFGTTYQYRGSAYASDQFNAQTGEFRHIAGAAGYGGFHAFWTNGVQRMLIDPAGLTTVSDLAVSNSASSRIMLGNTAVGGKTWIWNSYSNGNLYLTCVGTGDLFTVTPAGSVAVGDAALTNPQGWARVLQVSSTGTGGAALSLKDAFANGEWSIASYGGNLRIANGASGPFLIATPAGASLFSGYVLNGVEAWFKGTRADSSAEIPLIRARGMGYNPNAYPGVQIGQENSRIALFIDPASNASGAFSGTTNELILPSYVSFVQSNAAKTSWLNAMTLTNGNMVLAGDLTTVGRVTAQNIIYANTNIPADVCGWFVNVSPSGYGMEIMGGGGGHYILNLRDYAGNWRGNVSDSGVLDMWGTISSRNNFTLGGYSILPLQSDRDFPNGTLIQTDIDYSVASGEPWYLEIEGNSYSNLTPCKVTVQGYIYSSTVINMGGIANGLTITGMTLFNYLGKLCFWFPSQGYWNGYTVQVNSSYTGLKRNRLMSISHSAKPGGITKEVTVSDKISQVYHSGNIANNAAVIQSVVASLGAPLVGTIAERNAFVPAPGSLPYWYTTNEAASDGLMGSLYKWNGSMWIYVAGEASLVVGRITAGVISAGAIGAQALAVDFALANTFRSTVYTAGTYTVPATGFKFSGSLFTAYLLDGTSLSVYGEIGAEFSIGGMKAATIANRLSSNVFTRSTVGSTDILIPDGVSVITVALQGPGGQGFAGAGHGGGGGTFTMGQVTVKPHNTYRITLAAGTATTFSWVSFDGTSGFTSDSGFATMSAAAGANGTAGTSEVAGVNNDYPSEHPTTGWNITGATGGDGAAAAAGRAGDGGRVGTHSGGQGAFDPIGTYAAGGGGGASIMGNGGNGALNRNHATGVAAAGGTGAGGGAGFTPGNGGTGWAQVKWGI